MTRRTLLALPLATTAFAKRWDDRPFTAWNEEFIDRILSDSPWARPWRSTVVKVLPERMLSSFSQIGIGLPSPIPGGGGGWPGSPRNDRPFPRIPSSEEDARVLRVAADVTVRWASALPIRQALALQEFGRDRLDDPRAKALLAARDEFVIELAGIPRAIVGDTNEELVAELKKARLSVPGHRPLLPDSVELPTIGMYLTATLRFPRVTGIPVDSRKIELATRVGTTRLEQQFKIESMVSEGRLEL
jgi:hypothetical protein